MSTFTHRHVDDNKTMEITLSPDFSSDDQDELMPWFRNAPPRA